MGIVTSLNAKITSLCYHAWVGSWLSILHGYCLWHVELGYWWKKMDLQVADWARKCLTQPALWWIQKIKQRKIH